MDLLMAKLPDDDAQEDDPPSAVPAARRRASEPLPEVLSTPSPALCSAAPEPLEAPVRSEGASPADAAGAVADQTTVSSADSRTLAPGGAKGPGITA